MSLEYDEQFGWLSELYIDSVQWSVYCPLNSCQYAHKCAKKALNNLLRYICDITYLKNTQGQPIINFFFFFNTMLKNFTKYLTKYIWRHFYSSYFTVNRFGIQIQSRQQEVNVFLFVMQPLANDPFFVQMITNATFLLQKHAWNELI